MKLSTSYKITFVTDNGSLSIDKMSEESAQELLELDPGESSITRVTNGVGRSLVIRINQVTAILIDKC